jgi:hypothetical protein
VIRASSGLSAGYCATIIASRRPRTASSSRNCADWKPLEVPSASRNPANWVGVIVSSTSSWATTVFSTASVRRSVRMACVVSPSSSWACSLASSCSSCLNHSS